MLQFDVYDMGGEKVDSLSIDEATFGGTVNRAVLREAVLMYQANRRVDSGLLKPRSPWAMMTHCFGATTEAPRAEAIHS